VPLIEVQPQTSRAASGEKLALAGVLALTFLTFVSTFTFGWVYDDAPQIPQNPNLRWDKLGFLFTHHLWASAPGITNARFYRPLLSLWFLLNKTLFGLNPHWFHVTTVLLHVLATALVFLIARTFLKDMSASVLAAALFGVHPLQAESVSWISSVNDSLAAVLCFGSFLVCRKARKLPQNAVLWWSAAALLFFCALLTKEVSVVLPAIVLTDAWFDSDENTAQSLRTKSAIRVGGLYGAVAVVWVFMRHQVLGNVAAAAYSADWASALLTAPKILLFQLWHVILPAGLSVHYDLSPTRSDTITPAALPLCGVIGLAVVAALAARKQAALWVAYAWVIFPLLPSLNLRWLNEDDFVHDRYMYMSMLGIALLAGASFAALRRQWPEQRLVLGLAFALVIGLAFASAIQSQFWSNDVALFARGVQIAPQNEWAQLDYGAALSARGKFADAAPHFVKSYERKAGWKAADYAGFAYQTSGDPQQAERWYTIALQQNPSLADAWFALGQIRVGEQRPADAVPFFQKALAISPSAEGYHYALGLALEQSGQSSAALEAYRTELRLYPAQTGAQRALARLSVNP
jgi:tetratricopeptide (TPR) repeat protein